ncbi:zinc finger protein 502-like [Armigeres subalbatus]|uniref:zinc finger protein 502-like n=1 Tax=Armigeres subalbatus TaxID=124917 RepID=UPI002ED4C319
MSHEVPEISCPDNSTMYESLNDSDLANIKDEADIKNPQNSSSCHIFCTLCLRSCAPHMLLEFSSYNDHGVVNVRVAEQKVHHAIGLSLKLKQHGMCLTCWMLIELITDFKECCVKATNKLSGLSMGLANDDEWNSENILNGIDKNRKVIWEHIALIDSQNKLASYKSLDTEQNSVSLSDVKVNDFMDDVRSDMRTKTTVLKRKYPKRKSSARSKQSGVDVDVDEHTREQTPNNPTVESEPSELEKDNYQVMIASCDSCVRKFDGKRALKMHKAHCTLECPSSRKYYSCPICTASFSENSGLTFHMNKHKGTRPYKCRKFCDRTYASNYSRIKHERAFCEQENRICPICGASLKNEGCLNRHMQHVHGEAKYACEICGRRFRNHNVLADHRRVHSDERKYSCDECTKRFKSPFALRNHKRIHSPIRPFPCHVCDHAFYYKVLLKAHIQRHHGSNAIG